MRILIDMDGVLADFDQEFLQRWRTRHPEKVYIPLEDRKTFYIRDSYPQDLKSLVDDILLEESFFREMVPVHGAKEALHEMEAMGFEVFICTSPLSAYRNCVLEKYEWVGKYLGPSWVKKIILTRDKTIVKADYLIDDKPEIMGAEKIPCWEYILYDQPYNHTANKKRITWHTWKDVILLQSRSV